MVLMPSIDELIDDEEAYDDESGAHGNLLHEFNSEEAISMLDGKVSWNVLTFDQLTTKVTTFLSIKAQEVMTIVCMK